MRGWIPAFAGMTNQELAKVLKGSLEVESGNRPVSRVLSRTVIHLRCPSPDTCSDLPGSYADRIKRPLFGLASGGVYRAAPVASRAVRSYRTFSPLPVFANVGGLFSVALSVGLRRPGVTWRPVL